MLTGIGTITSALAILVAAFLGRQAATSFRKQKQTERELEHAERILAVSYQLNAALSAIRSPLTTGAELADSEKELEDNGTLGQIAESEKKRWVQANVVYRRARNYKKIYDEAFELLPFAKAYFGLEVEKALRRLIHARHTVLTYADAYAEDNGKEQEFSKNIRAFIWEGLKNTDGEDGVKKDADAAVELLEKSLLSVISDSYDSI